MVYYSFIPNPLSMKKNTMYFDVTRAKINKDIYRPSSNLIRFVKSLLAVIVSGNSSISPAKKRFH